MYFIVLSVGAYTLLLSSFITIVILLRRQFKYWMKTSLYILSLSDVLFSILTASILLINYMETYKENWDNIIFLNNSMWNDIDQTDQFIKFHTILTDITNENSVDIIAACNTMQIIMQYGMFLIPLTNSFVSLLMFSVQCNLNIFNLKHKSFLLKEYIGKNNETNQSEIQNIENCETIECKEMPFNLRLKLIEFYQTKFLKIFQIKENKRNDKVILTIFVINQWIIPIVVTGLLYLMEHNNGNYIMSIEKTKCFMESNVLFDDCLIDNNLTVMNTVENYSSLSTIEKHKDYINNLELINTSNTLINTSNTLINTSNTQINEIISKIQSIMYSVLNDTNNTSYYIGHIEPYNTTDFLNSTKYLDLNAHMGILNDNNNNNNNNNNNISNEWNSTEESKLVTEYESVFNITTIDILGSQNNVPLKNDTNEYSKEILLFNYLMTNFSQNVPIQEADTISTMKEVMEATIKSNIPTITNDQLHAEVLKYVHNATNNYYQLHNKKQPKQRSLQQDFNYNYIINKPNLSSIIQFIAYKTNNVSNITNIHIMDKCSISIQFLKMHLFLLSFIIYFLPILFCTILYQQGKLNCQLILIKLRTFANNIDGISFKQSIDSKKVFMSKQGSSNLKENTKEVKETTKEVKENITVLEQMEILNENFIEKRNEQHEINECDKRRMELNMTIQVQNTLKLFDTIKMSLLCGIMLWTPIFFEVSFKIFAQVFVPKWLFCVTYLLAVMFGTLRNFFNLRMIKLQDNDTSITKVNSIQPIV